LLRKRDGEDIGADADNLRLLGCYVIEVG